MVFFNLKIEQVQVVIHISVTLLLFTWKYWKEHCLLKNVVFFFF